MVYLVIAVAVGMYTQTLKWARVVDCAYQIISIARTSTAALRDPSLSDDQKERCSRRSSLLLFKWTAILVVRFAFAIIVPIIFLVLIVELRLVELSALMSTLESPPVVIIATLVIVTSLFWRLLSANWRK